MDVVTVFEFSSRDAAEFVVNATVVEPADIFAGGKFKIMKPAPQAFVPARRSLT